MKRTNVLSLIAGGALLLVPAALSAAEIAAAKAPQKQTQKVPAKIIAYAERDNALYKKGETIHLKAGVVDGTYYDQKGINAVALIPSREILLGRLLGSMKAPITNFARVLKQMAEKMEA